MQTREKILDDIARVAGGTVGAISSLQRQIREDVKARVEEMAHRLDLVPREDFERLEARIHKMHGEIENLRNRVVALEKENWKKDEDVGPL